MQRRSVQLLCRTFHDRGVRYLVAGGLAVVAHGYVRFTADVDLVLDLDPHNLRAALDVLRTLGYRPRAPVELDEFLDPGTRAAWVRDKGMTVFSLYSPQHPATEVDLFVEEPVDFPAAYARRVTQEIEIGTPVTFVGLDDLFEMKRRAGRAQDLLTSTACYTSDESQTMPESDDRKWTRGWDDHQQAQQQRLARLSLAEKLAWLEEADAMVRHLQRARRPAAGAVSHLEEE